jgi:hypothetical protein
MGVYRKILLWHQPKSNKTQIQRNRALNIQIRLEDSTPSHHLMILLSARKTSFIHYDMVVRQWQHMGLSS